MASVLEYLRAQSVHCSHVCAHRASTCYALRRTLELRVRSSSSLHASSKAAAHACCGGAPSPLPFSDTDIAKQRSKRSLFCRRTADPSHTDATMWPKHAPEISAADTNWSCGPRGFHVHAWSEPRMCLHHAHFLSCASVGPRLRRVPRASIATHPKREEGGSSRENLSGENLPKKSSDLKFAREGPHPSAVTLRTTSSALASLIRKPV